MSKEQVNTRLPADIYQDFDDFRESKDLGKAEAARRLIVQGLDSNDLQDRLADEQEERIRLEERVQNLERERDQLEEDLEEAEQEVQSWKAKYNESQGKLKVHHSEKGAVDRVKDWLFGG
jgi:chromosome segregation ATPase